MDKRLKPNLPVLVIKEDNKYIVFCPAFAVANQGPTIHTALYNVKEGLEIFLNEIDLKNDFIPLDFN